MADQAGNNCCNQTITSVSVVDISNQAINTTVLPGINVSNSTSTSASPNASDETTSSNYLQAGRQEPADNEPGTLRVSSAMLSYRSLVDNGSGYLKSVDNENGSLKVMNSDPDYQRLIRVDDEPGYQLAVRDEPGFYRKTDDNAPRAFDEPGYLQIMNDEPGYIEVVNDEPNYLQIVNDEIGYLQIVNDEPDHLQPVDNESSYLPPIDNLSSYLQVVADEPGYLQQVQLADNALGNVQVAVDEISYLKNVQVVQPAKSSIETDYLQQVQIAANEPHSLQAGNSEPGYFENVRVVVPKSGCRQLDNGESEHHQAIDTVAGYSEIEDNEAGYNEIEDNETGYNEIDDNEPGYQEIADYESEYQQVVSDNFGYSEIDINEQLNQPRIASNGNSPVACIEPDADANRVRQRIDASRNCKRYVYIATLIIAIPLLIAGVVYKYVTYDNIKPQAKLSAQLRDTFGLKQTLTNMFNSKLITFDAEVYNVGKNDSLPSNYFVVPHSHVSRSLYWMHTGVEIPPLTPAYIRLSVAVSTSLSINTTSSDNNTQTISRSGLIQLEPGTHVSVVSDYNVTTTYWSGFALNTLMNPLVAFYVACSEATLHNRALMYDTHIRYDVVIVNEGNAWDTSNNCLRAPHAGVYLVSVSIELGSPGTKSTNMRLALIVNHIDADGHPVGHVKIRGRHSNMVSVSYLIKLKLNATVWAKFKSTSINNGGNPEAKASTFSAFYYSPVSNARVAWLTFKYTPGQHLYEKTAFINQGNAWSDDKATIPRTGIYYTVVNIHSTCNQITLWLRVNGQKILKVKSTSKDTVQSLTRNTGAVIRLAVNDTLTVDIDMTAGVAVPVSSCFTVADPHLKGLPLMNANTRGGHTQSSKVSH